MYTNMEIRALAIHKSYLNVIQHYGVTLKYFILMKSLFLMSCIDDNFIILYV